MTDPITLRWIVRQEVSREPKFGETKRDVLRWAVRQYIEVDGKRVFATPTYYGALSAAAEEARRRCAERYGCVNRQHHHHDRSRR